MFRTTPVPTRYCFLTTAALGHADSYGWDTVLWRKDGADWSLDELAVRGLTPERL